MGIYTIVDQNEILTSVKMKKKKHPKLIVFTAIKDIEIDFKRID
jgi:hypothetical protein